MIRHRRWLAGLSILFAIWWVALAIAPLYRQDWALENVLVVFAVTYIVATCRKIPMSRISYTLIFVFLCLHVLGAHYTYAETPYDEWGRQLFGFSVNELFGFQRNQYDRVIHFAFGLLLAYPVRELFIRVADTKGFWAYFFPLIVTMAASMFYEVFEWVAAVIFGGDLGVAWLGTQGDVWDAQKDMAVATLGALIAMSITALIYSRVQRDFAREWNTSLTVKVKRPLGEDEIMQMLEGRKQ